MNANLTRQILEAHALPRARGGGEEATGEWALRVDQFVCEAAAAPLVFAALPPERGATRSELWLTCVDPAEGGMGGEVAEALRLLAERARARGAQVSRAGNGGCDQVHRERFAAPGKLAAHVGRGALSCGALGMLAASLSAIETAFVLGGGAWYRARMPVLGVRLRGSLASWVGGTDLALEVGRRMTARGAMVGVVEFHGPGVAALSMGDRLAAASLRDAFGASTALFPSDETTRGYLRAQGREVDWKPLAGEAEAAYEAAMEIDLDSIEPMVAPHEDPGAARSARHAMGIRVQQVLVGPGATVTDLARFCRALGGRPAHAGTQISVVPGSRQVTETAGRLGLLESLAACGARVLDAGTPLGSRAAAGSSGTGLACGGIPRPWLGRGPAWHVAGPETCAAAALCGRITDPRELDAEFVRDAEPESYVVDDGWILRPEAGAGAAATPVSFPVADPLLGPLRGPVLLKLGDHVTTELILPWGARLEPMIADIEGLAEHAFTLLEAGFAARARRHGGGFVVAGLEFGCGPEREQASLVAVSLGIRAVLARSFAPRFRTQLVHAGVLPLSIGLDADYRAMRPGDELEIPGLPESLEAGKPLEVRNLTRGTQHTLRHDLDARETAIMWAGGLLRFAGERPAAAARS